MLVESASLYPSLGVTVKLTLPLYPVLCVVGALTVPLVAFKLTLYPSLKFIVQ